MSHHHFKKNHLSLIVAAMLMIGGSAYAYEDHCNVLREIRNITEDYQIEPTNQEAVHQLIYQSRCVLAPSEGFVAVGVPVKDVDSGYSAIRWGFLSSKGQMAIHPQFNEVRSFSQNLAAAKKDDLWGYIDTAGHWAIEPQFLQANDFNADGLAVVQRKGRFHLINRTGVEISPAPWGEDAYVQQVDASSPLPVVVRALPTRIPIKLHQPRLPDPSVKIVARIGKSSRWIASKTITADSPDDSSALTDRNVYGGDSSSAAAALTAATAAAAAAAAAADAATPFYVSPDQSEGQSQRFGILNADGSWHIPPSFYRIDQGDGDITTRIIIATKADGSYDLIDRQGNALGRSYREVNRLDENFLAGISYSDTDNRYRYELMDSTGKVISKVNSDEIGQWTYHHAALVQNGRKTTSIYTERLQKKITLPKSVAQGMPGEDGFYYFFNASEKVVAIATPQGSLLTGPKIESRLEILPKVSRDNRWITFYDKKLAQHLWDDEQAVWVPIKNKEAWKISEFFPSSNSQLSDKRAQPVAYVERQSVIQTLLDQSNPDDCCCGDEDSHKMTHYGVLWSDGTVLNPIDGAPIQFLGMRQGEELTKENTLWKVSTKEGIEIVDGNAKPLTTQRFGQIGPWKFGMSIAGNATGQSVVSADGSVITLPDVFDLEPIGPHLLRFRQEGHDSAPWFLFDVKAQKTIQGVSFQAIDTFNEKYSRAPAANAAGQWGVIDLSGQWVVPPSFGRPHSRGDDWLVMYRSEVETDDDGYFKYVNVPTSLIRWDGTALMNSSATIDVEALEICNQECFMGYTKEKGFDQQVPRAVVFDKNGNVLVDENNNGVTVEDAHWRVEAPVQSGFITAQGQWAFAPVTNALLTPYRQGQSLKLSTKGGEVIDAQGKTVLEIPSANSIQWSQLQDGYMITSNNQPSRSSVTQFFDHKGRELLKTDKPATPFANGLTSFSEERAPTWFDAKGKEVANVKFDFLGQSSNNLAAACEGGLCGFVDAQFQYKIPAKYDAVTAFNHGMAVAIEGNDNLFIQTDGKVIARMVSSCDQEERLIYNDKNELIWPQKAPECSSEPSAEDTEASEASVE